ncbi:hypothetical protein ACLOJK_024153, partial [Asimina triloba]
VHHRSTKIRCSIFFKGLSSDPTPARVRSADRTHPNERRQRVNPRSKLPSRSDDIERLTLHFLHFGPATPSRSRTTPPTSPASRPFFSDPDEAAPNSTVRHQLPTAAGVQEPASAHIIQHLARQHERVRLHSMATHQVANSKSEAASASSLAIRTKKITRRRAAVLMAVNR